MSKRYTLVTTTLTFVVDGNYTPTETDLIQTPGFVECLGEFDADNFDPVLLTVKTKRTKLSKRRVKELTGFSEGDL